MAEQHNGVIGMAKDEQQNSRNVVSGEFADDVADAAKGQPAEIKQIQGILDRL